jgi:hypothetical protein
LPFPRKDVAAITGLMVSAVCMALYAGLNAEMVSSSVMRRVFIMQKKSHDYVFQGISDTEDFVQQFFADGVFYLTLNFIGFYFRYVGEINMRRGFLDKRGCIETTFKLKYEKEQEVRFVSSQRGSRPGVRPGECSVTNTRKIQ